MDDQGKQELSLTERVSRLEQIEQRRFETNNREGPVADYHLEKERAAARAAGRATDVDEARLINRRMSEAVAGINQACEKPRTLFEEFTCRVRDMTNHLSHIACELEQTGDRVFGPRPEEDAGKSLGVHTNGTVDELSSMLGFLDNEIRRVERAQERIAGI